MDVEVLFETYKDDVYRLALSFTRNPQEAEDVCQTVFLKFMEHTVTPGKERAWLMQVTANQCRSLLRSHWWRGTVPLEDCAHARESSGNMVLESLLLLPPRYRVVLYLHYYECMSTAEIAKLLRVSQSTVTTRLSRGRRLLKSVLREESV